MFDDTGRWMAFAICRCRRLCPCELHQEVLPEPKWAGTIAHWRGCWATKRWCLHRFHQLQSGDLPMTQETIAHDLLWFTVWHSCVHMYIYNIYTSKAVLQFECFVIQSRIIIPSDVLFFDVNRPTTRDILCVSVVSMILSKRWNGQCFLFVKYCTWRQIGSFNHRRSGNWGQLSTISGGSTRLLKSYEIMFLMVK